MQLVAHDLIKLHFDGGKSYWVFNKSDLLSIDGVEYIALPCGGVGCGFARPVIEDCPTCPSPMDKNFSLTWSIGYNKLKQARADEVRRIRVEEARAKIPEMFRKTAQVAVPKQTAEEIQNLRNNPTAIQIKL